MEDNKFKEFIIAARRKHLDIPSEEKKKYLATIAEFTGRIQPNGLFCIVSATSHKPHENFCNIMYVDLDWFKQLFPLLKESGIRFVDRLINNHCCCGYGCDCPSTSVIIGYDLYII